MDTPILERRYNMAKIGKRAQAKKYKELREKQEMANRFIRMARKSLKPNHKALKQLKAKKKTFYNMRGIKSPAQLSFKSLSTKDLKAYEHLLDSIINDTYLNPDKHNAFKNRMSKIFGGSLSGANGSEFAEFVESDIFDDLVNMGVDPYVVRDIYNGVTSSNMTVDEFIDMCIYFKRDVDNGNATVEDFYTYADEFAQYLEDFKNRVDAGEYEPDEFDDYYKEYYGMLGFE